MNNSVDTVDNAHGTVLRRQLAAEKSENKRLRREVRELRKQRDRWREEARNWKWGALRRK